MTHWFDDLLRGLASTTTTRRGALKLLAVGLATSALGSAPPTRATAQQGCFHSICTSYFWFDVNSGTPYSRLACYGPDQGQLTTGQCVSRTPSGPINVNGITMVQDTSMTVKADIYDGECRWAVKWQAHARGHGRPPAPDEATYALLDEAEPGMDQFGTSVDTPVGDAIMMAKQLDPTAATTGARDNRVPTECACDPGFVRTCGRCCEPVLCGQPLNCCLPNDGGCGTIVEGLGCIQRCT
jgi:hypothetical protein